MNGNGSNGSLLAVLMEPVAPFLDAAGIGYRTKQKDGGTWLNLAKCPHCDKNHYQCGVMEKVDADGRLIHAFKCWHNGELPYEEFLYLVGAVTNEELHEIKQALERVRGKRKNGDNQKHHDHSDNRAKGNPEYRDRCHSRLLSNEAALKYLTEVRRLDNATIKEFSLGLSLPTDIVEDNKKTVEKRSDAWVCPIRQRDGSFAKRYSYYNIPGISVNPINHNSWCKGSSATYYSAPMGLQRFVFVCEGIKDLLRTAQALRGTKFGREILLISSTHGSSIPHEWKSNDFWKKWDQVYLGHDADTPGDTMALAMFRYLGRSAKRVAVPRTKSVKHKDWTDFWNAGGTVEEFTALLEGAPEMTFELSDNGQKLGLVACEALDNVTLSYRKGYLYYSKTALYRTREGVTSTDNKSTDSNAKILERYETIVLRSDGKILTTVYSPAPEGTRKEAHVLRLTDGTLVSKEPRESMYATWSLPSIKKFCKKTSKTRPLGEIIADIKEHLRGRVWLPHEEDYTLLAMVVIVTYIQELFEAVPLVFANGAQGSGKSQTGRAMFEICCNAVLTGQMSAATVARLIDESRGFVVIDDLEAIASKKDSNCSELVQALKVSYNKHTALKAWTDMSKGFRTALLNFYGVKFINNTSGVDSILGSRMLHIYTLKIPNQAIEREFRARRKWTRKELDTLRDEIHTWSFQNVALVEEHSRSLFKVHTDREEEITAPLLVVASIADVPQFDEELTKALQRQRSIRQDPFDSSQTLEDSVRFIISEGYREISIQHLINEMRTRFGETYDKEYEQQIPEWQQPRWVGRQLRALGVVEVGSERRARLFGSNLRVSPIAERYLHDTVEGLRKDGIEVGEPKKDPFAFCRDCQTCPYKSIDCDIRPRRMNGGQN